MKIISILIFLLIFISPVNSAISDELIGITWCGEEKMKDNCGGKKKKNKCGGKKKKKDMYRPKPIKLISFNPRTGAKKELLKLVIKELKLVKKELKLVKKELNECFRGLAYDKDKNMLYALSQSNWNLYSINPRNLQTKFIGKLDIENLPLGKNTWGKDIGGLTYDPESGIFYTSVSHWSSDQTNVWSELVTFDPKKPARVKRIGKNKERMIGVKSLGVITCGHVSSVSFNEDDGQIYAFAVDRSGSWDSSYVSSLVRINPENANMTTLFETPYHTILGLAQKPVQKLVKKPDEIIFYSWVNTKKHHYAKINVTNKSIKLLPESADPTGVNSDAMLFKNFDIGNSK